MARFVALAESAAPLHLVLVSEDIGEVAAIAVLLRSQLKGVRVSTALPRLDGIVQTLPDLMVMDLGAPSLDRLMMLRVLRSRFPKCPAIVLGDQETDELVQELRAVSVHGYFRRPLAFNALLDRVELLLATEQSRRLTSRVGVVVEFLGRNYSNRFSLHELAGFVGLSRSQLAYVFRREIGMSLKECLTKIRVEVARQLLRETDEKLEAVADRAGFADASHLSRVFLKYSGHRPGWYRQRRWRE